MYKKYATILLLGNLVIMAAFLSVSGVVVNLTAVQEAFRLTVESKGEVLQATNYMGVTKEKISEQRVLDLNMLTRERRISVTQSDYEDLLRIVEAEAGGEDKTGKILVANVVLNRVEDAQFPDTVSEVIFQCENGTTQFSPVSDGRFFTVKVSEETIEAVEEALDGEDPSGGALYFVARKYVSEGKMRWFDQNLTRLFSYGGHEFFA